jgi:hypothetical protein
MRLADRTFNMFNQAAGNASNMVGQGQRLMGQGLGQMGQASGGYRNAAQGMGQGMGMWSQMGQGLGNAIGTYSDMASMRPDQIQAGSLANTNLEPYMNPFQRQVTDATMSELNRQETMQANAMRDQAQRAGAFGGSRMAVQEAENNRNFDATRAQTLANLNSQNFTNAQGQATNDINRNFQAQQANQNMNAGMMQGGASGLAGLGGQAASGMAGLGQFGVSGLGQMGQSMAGMGQNQQQFGQNQLGSLANQGFQMGQSITNQNLAMGQLQQQQQQQLLNLIKGQTQGWQNYGDTGLARYFGATQSPNGYGTTTTNGTSTTSTNPGGMGILGAIMQGAGLFM